MIRRCALGTQCAQRNEVNIEAVKVVAVAARAASILPWTPKSRVQKHEKGVRMD